MNEAQLDSLNALARLHGPGEIRAHDEEILRWVWFRTGRQDWCIDERGRLRGWNDVEVPDA